ncbi:GntR family transcriptional regulator [Clostridium boliviensis]|uniref:GntR family transcriptional regulator n=1 Tax=Clostridium boliviensis TaxID=318465 RepID=A0ABU4GLX0_9CLOT|nr:GntR family transcriptional regulator [Clostridium boliviensis]MDW2798618.1 GntR family transcriptional regulator [Clostridium boliviensis]
MKLFDRSPGENARNYAVRVLLYNIINLELAPGSAVSENELSSTLNLSRTPVREALIELSKSGLVEILPQRGSYISKINYEHVEESRFMRLVLEIAVLKLACENPDPVDLKMLKNNINEQKFCLEREDTEKFFPLDNEFHMLLFQSVNKTKTFEVIKSQMVHFDRIRTLSLKSTKPTRIVEDHENILYAIERRDSELAEIVMTRHINRHQMEKSELIASFPDYFIH